MNTFERDKAYVAPTYARFPVEIVSGKGALLVDAEGKEYIDLGSGIAVNTLGVADEGWKAAVVEQLDSLQHASNLYYTAPCARLAEALCVRTGMKKVFFSNSGAEANECAIKVARKYAALHKGEEAFTILTLKNSFHGRTITTLSATGQDVFHQSFLPLTPGFVHAAAGDLEEVKRIADSIPLAAIMMEMVQGEGGVVALDPAFVAGVAALAKEKDILLITDEVQCGNGRTGKLYGYMHYGITPDVVTTAKGLGGGLPIGVTMLGEKVEDIFSPGDNGSTFGGNPAVCAGALHILSRLDEEMLAGVTLRGNLIRERLSGKSGIKSVSGLGLMVGIETEKDAGEVIAACRERGVLVIKAKNKVRLLPPLNIPVELLEKALAVICEAAAL
ncbi:MAG: acetylornithine/succinylornithine family transaminase [Clostridia bacterium]|nr:acetylornithine/succinylornithine family transaminase [Clostridia bacterium]